MALGTTDNFDWEPVTNATGTDAASTIYGDGIAYNGGFADTVSASGIYKASLSGVWAASMNTDGILVEMRLACTGAPTLHEEATRLSMAVAGASNVQTNTPFSVATWLQVDASGGDVTLECVLEKEVLDVSDDGSDILFHNVHEPITIRNELSVAL